MAMTTFGFLRPSRSPFLPIANTAVSYAVMYQSFMPIATYKRIAASYLQGIATRRHQMPITTRTNTLSPALLLIPFVEQP